MKKILLKPLLHRGQEWIGIYFDNYGTINTLIRKQAGAKWSKTNKCWYIPLSKEAYNKLFFALKGKAEIEQSGLHTYLADKKKISAQNPPQPGIKKLLKPGTKTTVNKGKSFTNNQLIINKTVVYKGGNIHSVNAHVLPAMEQYLKLKAYSSSTIRTYLSEVTQLLVLLKNSPADELTTGHLMRYFVFCFEKLHLKENTLHSRINALKFYFEKVLRREKFFWEIPRPKKPFILPNVLGEKEITRLFNAVTNLKHKAILFTAYSAGLRVSEVVNMKVQDVSSDRMQIKIVAAKGKKDRYVGLSPVLLDVLRSYLRNAKPRPLTYLFESEIPGESYSSRSAQKVFQRAREKAGIRKDISFHSLRHSFATHLLEKGIDIRFIKDILGHFSIKTTERYTHVRKEQLVHITSPLDDLWLKGEIL